MKHSPSLAALARWACCLVVALVVVQACSSGPVAMQVTKPGPTPSFCPDPFAVSNGHWPAPGSPQQRPEFLNTLTLCAAGGLANLGHGFNSSGCIPNPTNAQCPGVGTPVSYRGQPMELPLDLQGAPATGNPPAKPPCPLDRPVADGECQCPPHSRKVGNTCKLNSASERAAAQKAEIIAAMRVINDRLKLDLAITEAPKR
jgi:hypothetical protein